MTDHPYIERPSMVDGKFIVYEERNPESMGRVSHKFDTLEAAQKFYDDQVKEYHRQSDFLTRTKCCPDCHGKGWYKEESAPVTRQCHCTEKKTDPPHTGQTINIHTIEDLIQLDDRQLDACLKDLKTWVKFRQEMAKRLAVSKKFMISMGATEEMVREALKVEMQSFMAWIDDGVDGGNITFTLQTGEDGQKEDLAKATFSPEGKYELTSFNYDPLTKRGS